MLKYESRGYTTTQQRSGNRGLVIIRKFTRRDTHQQRLISHRIYYSISEGPKIKKLKSIEIEY